MSAGAWMMVLVTLVALGSLVFLMATTLRSISNERSSGRSVWREFGLGLSLMFLFLGTWVAHGITQWQMFTDEQATHGQPVELGDFFTEFSQATLENWQSEFLQLFAFVVLAALYVHKGSAESKDGDAKLEASLRRIEEHLGTLPPGAATEESESWKLPDAPLNVD